MASVAFLLLCSISGLDLDLVIKVSGGHSLSILLRLEVSWNAYKETIAINELIFVRT